jgi:hypothetical protein
MKTITKKVFLSVLSFVLFTGVLMADGENPKKENSNVVSISGQVIDQITGETLAGVKLIIQGTNEVIYTDFDGEFQIRYDLNNKPDLTITLISYEGETIKLESTENLKIKLRKRK